MLVDNYVNSLEAITLILIDVFDFKVVPNTEEQIMEAMLKVVKYKLAIGLDKSVKESSKVMLAIITTCKVVSMEFEIKEEVKIARVTIALIALVSFYSIFISTFNIVNFLLQVL